MIRPLEASQEYRGGGNPAGAYSPSNGLPTHGDPYQASTLGGNTFWFGSDPNTGATTSGINSVNANRLTAVAPSVDPIHAAGWLQAPDQPSAPRAAPALPTSGETAQRYAPSQFQFPGSGGWVSAGQATRT